MTISLIVIADQQFGVGKGDQAPWKFPAHEEYFNQLTSGHPVIMGRKTYDVRGSVSGATNMVVSKEMKNQDSGVYWSTDLFDATERCKWKNGGEEIFIVGGGELFESALIHGIVQNIYLTHITRKQYDCDVFFQDSFLKESFRESHRTVRHADIDNPERLEFIVYNRRKAGEPKDQKKTQ